MLAILDIGFGAFKFIIAAALMVVVPILGIYLIVKVFQGAGYVIGGVFRLIGSVFGRVGAFVRGMCLDTLHTAGGALTFSVLGLLSLGNLLIGRPGSARHYARALEDEATSIGLSMYRLALGHPVRLLGLSALTDGLERRLPDLVSRDPQVLAMAPLRDVEPSFEGYDITGTLPAGGSGARLFLAVPKPARRQELARRGRVLPDRVVIKAFDLEQGSTLPQIVRESRALEAAGRLGLVLEHDLSPQNFHYVMPYVPGETVDVVTTRMHGLAGDDGLDTEALRRMTAYAADMLATLDRFHREGLWHKDIKPSNLIVSDGRVQIVDLGLVTPLASAMTLTTHGTEYFRDPELVRLALQGVKVHEVDGVKFDIYSAGAVLFSMVEGSFPAHGSLSRITKRCPQALSWIIRRSMADMGSRYPSASIMNRDLAHVLAARDPYDVLPAELPSETEGVGQAAFTATPAPEPMPMWAPAPAAAGVAAKAVHAGPEDSAGPVTRAAVKVGYPGAQAPAGTRTERRVRRRRSSGALALAAFAFLFLVGTLGLGLMTIGRVDSSDFEPSRTWDPQWVKEIGGLKIEDRTLRGRDLPRVYLHLPDGEAPGNHLELREALLESQYDPYIPGLELDPERSSQARVWEAQAMQAEPFADVSPETFTRELSRVVRTDQDLDMILWADRQPDGSLSFEVITEDTEPVDGALIGRLHARGDD